MMDHIFEFNAVEYEAPGKLNGTGPTRIIKNATFTLHKGDYAVIIGPSGAGKSTLLRLFNRLADPSGGGILFNGRDIFSYPVQELRRQIGWMPQLPVCFPGTVDENLRLPFRIAGTQKQSDEEIDSAIEGLKELKLLNDELYNRQATDLSVGEAQRMSLLRALALKPDVLLLDEPTSALDRENASILLEQVNRIRTEWNLTIVHVSHRPEDHCRPENTILRVTDGIVEGRSCCTDGGGHDG